MVHANAQGNPGETQLVLQPNRSLSWKQTKMVFSVVAFCLIIIACYFTIKGAWLVLPFAGIELLVIGLGFYLQCRFSHRQQVISISDDIVSVGNGQSDEEQISFSRSWLKISHLRDSRDWYPARLLIGSHGRYIEVGSFLVESERNRLADNLRCAIKGA